MVPTIVTNAERWSALPIKAHILGHIYGGTQSMMGWEHSTAANVWAGLEFVTKRKRKRHKKLWK
jgi:hypothetical protein